MPKLEVRRLRRMVWSIVSNAALRSKERERERELKSGESIIGCIMVNRIEEVNERGLSRVMFAIS